MTKFAKISVATAVALMPFMVLAQLPLPTNPVAGATGLTLDEIRTLIESVARFVILISVVVAVIFIVWGGIKYAMAGEDSAKASAAKTTMLNGIIGALIMLAVGVIMQTLANVVARMFFNV